ncbi:MAG: hypothetical protein IAI48_00505 [Candidatus Eremiobacteraeota bacterium]|nr:hypothetical protein [Candidatus Eremiobacteraeota bacterium]
MPKRKAKRPRTTGKPNGRPPSVWTAKNAEGQTVEQQIVTMIEKTGCSYRDAAEMCGVVWETFKKRQREDSDFSALVHKARLGFKVGTLGHLAAAAAAGNVAAGKFWLERACREEWGFRIYDDGSATAAAAHAAEAAFAEDVAIGRALRGDSAALEAIDRLARTATALRASAGATGAGVPRERREPRLPDGAAPAAAEPRADRRRRKANP